MDTEDVREGLLDGKTICERCTNRIPSSGRHAYDYCRRPRVKGIDVVTGIVKWRDDSRPCYTINTGNCSRYEFLPTWDSGQNSQEFQEGKSPKFSDWKCILLTIVGVLLLIGLILIWGH